jgi:surface protein
MTTTIYNIAQYFMSSINKLIPDNYNLITKKYFEIFRQFDDYYLTYDNEWDAIEEESKDIIINLDKKDKLINSLYSRLIEITMQAEKVITEKKILQEQNKLLNHENQELYKGDERITSIESKLNSLLNNKEEYVKIEKKRETEIDLLQEQNTNLSIRIDQYINDSHKYIFKTNDELRFAVKMWCDTYTHEFILTYLGHISLWNTVNITDMSDLFSLPNNLFNDNINNWDTGKVTNMKGMFSGCNKFNQPLDNWDVSNVVDMNSMFSDCSAFNQSLDNWNINKETDITLMFDEDEESDATYNDEK